MKAIAWIAAVAFLTASASGLAAAPEEHGSGQYPALFEQRADLPDHVVYRPEKLAGLGQSKLGVYVFGNGGCSADGTSSRNHLLEIASHGYLAIAAGTIPTPGTKRPASQPGTKLSAETPTRLLADAIDWAQRENERADSPFFHRIATDQIAVSGWSCGGLQALTVSPDPRVKTTIVMNSGFFNDGKTPIEGITSDKAMLNQLHGSILYVLGGPTDIAFANGSDDYRRITQIPVALVNIPVGHGGTYMQPHGGTGAEVVTAWLDWKLKNKPGAAAKFVGAECGFCLDPRLSIESKNLR